MGVHKRGLAYRYHSDGRAMCWATAAGRQTTYQCPYQNEANGEWTHHRGKSATLIWDLCFSSHNCRDQDALANGSRLTHSDLTPDGIPDVAPPGLTLAVAPDPGRCTYRRSALGSADVRTDAEAVMEAASELKRAPKRITSPGLDPDRVSFTHLRVEVAPQEVLRRLRSSAVEALLSPDGTLLNDPTEDWYIPITPVHAQPELLVDAYVSASLWQPPTWDWSAGEVEVCIVFDEGGKRAYEAVGVWAAPDKATNLYRYSFDTQRAETGYEGAGRISLTATPTAVVDLLSVAKGVVGGTS